MSSENNTETPETEEEVIEEMATIVRHDTLVEALAYAQLEYEPLIPNKTVDYVTKKGDRVNYSYATLDALRAATDPCLNKHGLTLTHYTEIRDKREILVAVLRHAYSDTIDKAELDITESSGDMQDFGKLMTFAERYTYSMLTGRAAEKDTDARDGKRRKNEQQPGEQQPNKQGDKQPSGSNNAQLEAAKVAFFKLLTEEDVFVDDDARHKWQGIAFPKQQSTTTWAKAKFVQAKALMLWRLETGVESDELLSYTTTKAKSVKGLVKQFLAIYGVSKLTEVSDVSQWKIAMASARLSIDHKLEAALDMGKVLMRVNGELFEHFKQQVEVDKLSKMNASQVESWQPFLKLAVDKYNVENAENTVDFDKLVKGE